MKYRVRVGLLFSVDRCPLITLWRAESSGNNYKRYNPNTCRCQYITSYSINIMDYSLHIAHPKKTNCIVTQLRSGFQPDSSLLLSLVSVWCVELEKHKTTNKTFIVCVLNIVYRAFYNQYMVQTEGRTFCVHPTWFICSEDFIVNVFMNWNWICSITLHMCG